MRALIRLFGRRLVIMVGGEAMQSALHFVLNIGLLHALPAREYGVFALVMVMGGLGLTYIRALSAMPASVWIGRSRSVRAANAYDVTFGSGAFVLASAIAAIVGLVLHGWGQHDALAGGAFVGLWSLRSHLRTAIFARGNPMPVATGDAVFTLCGVLLSAALLGLGPRLGLTGAELQDGAFVLLALANWFGIAATLIAWRRRVRLSLRRSVRRRYGSLWRQLGWSGIGITTTNLQGQGLALIVAVMAGPAGYAPIAAIFVLFVPLRIVAAAVANMMQPDLAASMAGGDYAKAWQHALLWTLILGCGSLAYGGTVMLALPLFATRVFDGVPLHVIGALTWAIYTASMLYVMPRIILEAEGALRIIAAISAAGAVIGMALVAAILSAASPAWSLLGALASELLVLAGSWLALRHCFVRAASRIAPSAMAAAWAGTGAGAARPPRRRGRP